MTLRVLLVDDDPERAATLRAALQAAGYEGR
jgi:DNA-binding response OmpR family regulator